MQTVADEYDYTDKGIFLSLWKRNGLPQKMQTIMGCLNMTWRMLVPIEVNKSLQGATAKNLLRAFVFVHSILLG